MERFEINHEENHIMVAKTEGTSIAYTEEFKELVEQNPGVIKNSIAGIRRLDDDEFKKETEIDGCVVEKQDIPGQEERPCYKVFKKDSPENAYFVKNVKDKESPYKEILAMKYVKGLLADLPWVEVVDYQLGFASDKGDRFYVARWNQDMAEKNFQRVREDMPFYKFFSIRKVRNLLKMLRERLAPYNITDVGKNNAAFDFENGKMYLFDLRYKGNFAELEEKMRGE